MPSGYAAGPTENWRAITQQQLSGERIKRDLFELAYALQLNQEVVCADAHLNMLPPLEPFAPQGAGSLLLLGARLARGGAPEEEGTGLCPVPPYCARDFSRRIPAANVTPNTQASFRGPNGVPVRAPPVAPAPRTARPFAGRAHRTFGLRWLALTGVAASRLRGMVFQST